MSKKIKDKIGIGIIKTNFKQLTMSKNLYISIAVIVMMIVLSFFRLGTSSGYNFNLDVYIGENSSIANLTWNLLFYPTANNLIVLVSALPTATIFCTEWNSKYIRSVAGRTGVGKYARHKVLTCYLGTFAAVFIAMTIFTLFMFCTGTPMMSESERLNLEQSYRDNGITSLLMDSPYIFHLFHMICYSSYTAVWSVAGLAASAYIPNPYIVYAMPFSAFYIFEGKIYNNVRINSFTKWFNIPDFGHCYTGFELTGNRILDFIYIVFVFSVIVLLIGEIFVYGVKRRMRDEMV